MTFHPAIQSDWLVLLTLFLLGAPLLLVPRNPHFRRRVTLWVVLGLRLTAIALLVLVMANPVARHESSGRQAPVAVVALLDTSKSMGLGTKPRLREGLALLKDGMEAGTADKLMILPFDRDLRVDPLDAWGSPPEANGSRTCLGAALARALPVVRGLGARHIVVVSDGRCDDPVRLAAAASSAGSMNLPVSVIPVGSPPKRPNVAIVNCLTERQVPVDSRVPVSAVLRVSGCRGKELELRLTDDEGKVLDHRTFPGLDGTYEKTLHAVLGETGKNLHLVIPPLEDELSTEDNRFAFRIDVATQPIRVLYMEGSNHKDKRWTDVWEYDFIAQALRETGNIDVDVFTVDKQVADGGKLFNVAKPDQGFPTDRATLWQYDVVICSDINRTIFTDKQLEWTRDLVARRGGGFCMIGGYTAFGAGKWDHTVWEQMIPVDMKTEADGYVWEDVVPQIPEAARNHPLWHVEDDPEANRLALSHHPPFLGFNLVNRAKPAAKILAWHQDRQMPLICVQPYGRGRSMAFLSDAAGGWGERYQTEWGEGDHDNRYYRRFWVNAVRWLAEHSQSAHRARLVANTDAVTYAPGDIMTIRARKLVLTRPEDLRQWTVSARLAKGDDQRPIPLVLDEQTLSFVGRLAVPADSPSMDTRVLIEARGPAGGMPDVTSIPIRIAAADRELADPFPDPLMLRQLAERTGGHVITDANQLRRLLQKDAPATAGAAKRITVPLWDRPWLWALIVILLAAEWLVRKAALFGKV